MMMFLEWNYISKRSLNINLLNMTREQKLVFLLAQFKELGIDRQIDYDRWQEVGLSFQVQFVKRDFSPTEKGYVGITCRNKRIVSMTASSNQPVYLPRSSRRHQ